MPKINILNLLEGDNQPNLVDKINYNFDQILSAGGGPQGVIGPQGSTGPIGPQGLQGIQGIQGFQGSKWFVQGAQGTGPGNTVGGPIAGNITGYNPATYPTVGDYWLDVNSNNQEIYVYLGGATGWQDTGLGLAQGDIFQKLIPVKFTGGGTGIAIMISGNESEKSTLVLSDSDISDYTTTGNAATGTNYENAKLKIATFNRENIISFSKSNYEDDGGGSGGIGSSINPGFSWQNATDANYNIIFKNPTGAINIVSGGSGTTGAGINIEATGVDGEVSLSSSQSYIVMSPGSSYGAYADIDDAANGWFEVSNQPSTSATPQGGAYAYVDSTGAGFGLGRGDILLGNRKRLSISGSSSIGETLLFHNDPYSSSTIYGGNGSLYVEKSIGIGALNPTGRNGTSPSIPTSNPKLWVVRGTTGAAVEFRSDHLTAGIPAGRTIIGSGDSTKGEGISTQISQDAIMGTTGPGSEYPVSSTEHRIWNNAIDGLKRVFGSITYANGVNPTKTLIETKWTNKILQIQANPSATGGQVQIGVTGTTVLAVSGTGAGVSGPNSVSIGENAENFFSNTTAAGYSGGASANQRYHRLSVQGGTTIGTNEPLSQIAPASDNASGKSGRYSMVKVHRDRDIAKGADNNYPNGIEISITGTPGGTSTTENKSLSFSIVDRTSLGLSISDNGLNMAIGDYPQLSNLAIKGNMSIGSVYHGIAAPVGGYFIEGIGIHGKGVYDNSYLLSESSTSRITVIGGSGTYVGGARTLTAWGDFHGVSGVNASFFSDDTGVRYRTNIGQKDAGVSSNWRLVGTSEEISGTELFYTNGDGDTWSKESVRTRRYNAIEEGTSLWGNAINPVFNEFPSVVGNGKLYGIKRNEEIVSSGSVYVNGYFDDNAHSVIYPIENSLSTITIASTTPSTGAGAILRWTNCIMHWQRIGGIINSSIIIESMDGNNSSGYEHWVKIPFPVVLLTDGGSHDPRGYDCFGSGLIYSSNGEFNVEIKNDTTYTGIPGNAGITTYGNSNRSFIVKYFKSGRLSAAGAVRGTFSYRIY